jgi:predicted Zn finger-like uncharacterized protein
MALLTSCPQCHTTFRISEEALRKAAGQVRCGRCSNIFNAHAQLRDSEDAPKPRPAPAPGSPSASHLPEIVELSPSDPESRIRSATATPDPGAPLVSPPDAEDRASSDPHSGNDFNGGSDASRDVIADTILNPAPERGHSGPSGFSGRWTLPQLAATFGADRTRLWKAGVVFAGVVLLVQIANSFSDVLATRVPLVQSVYAALGVTLVPRWDLDRYEVLGASAATNSGTSGGNLVISARIRNRGTVAQPYPYVELRLLDRWERTVGRRAFAPANYSATSASTDAMLAPGASITAELVVVDPGPDAAGFEIDFCIDGAAGLRCDGDEVFE